MFFWWKRIEHMTKGSLIDDIVSEVSPQHMNERDDIRITYLNFLPI